jgi:2'-5' RNA ligase
MARYGIDSIFGVVFLPDDQTTQLLIKLSGELGAIRPSELALNDIDCRPHVTLIHVGADEQQATAYARSLDLDWSQQYELIPTSLWVSPWKSAAVGFLEIQNDEWLNSMHLGACDAAVASNLEIVSAAQDNFQPHVTMTYWSDVDAEDIMIPNPTIAPMPATLHLVEIGSHGTAKRIVALQ